MNCFFFCCGALLFIHSFNGFHETFLFISIVKIKKNLDHGPGVSIIQKICYLIGHCNTLRTPFSTQSQSTDSPTKKSLHEVWPNANLWLWSWKKGRQKQIKEMVFDIHLMIFRFVYIVQKKPQKWIWAPKKLFESTQNRNKRRAKWNSVNHWITQYCLWYGRITDVSCINNRQSTKDEYDHKQKIECWYIWINLQPISLVSRLSGALNFSQIDIKQCKKHNLFTLIKHQKNKNKKYTKTEVN